MIINSHVHFNTDNNFFFYSNYTIARFIKELDENNVDIAFPSLNPKISELRCPNDCSYHCKNCKEKVNNNLQYCRCDEPERHRTVVETYKGRYRLRCKNCGKILIYSKIDPLRKYNIELMKQTEKYRARIKPLLYISLCKATLQSEIDFYEKNFRGMYSGYKFHPWTDQVSVRNFEVKTNLPILIHTGLRDYELAEDAIYFALRHKDNKVIIAHAAQLKKELLEIISKQSNIFLDCCPADFLYKNKEICFRDYSMLSSPEDIFYEVLKFVDSSKILFGTDSPWGNTGRELDIISRLDVSEEVKDDILYKTALRVYL